MIDWNQPLVHLDGFGGCAGFWLALKNAGIKIGKHYYSEIEKNAIAVAKYHDRDLIDVGAIENVYGFGIERPDLFTFGSPCQDFSMAGERAGLGGAKSSLIIEAIKIIDKFRPAVFIWENVKGVFSSNDGADFWAVIQAFTNIGNYRLEWQLLNSDWVLPQNRERIYLVGHLVGHSELKVFPISEINKRDEQTPSEKGQEIRDKNSGDRDLKMEKGVFLLNRQKSRTLTGAGKNGGHNSDMDLIKTTKGYRRYTEIECERLQGFPDNWTQFGLFGTSVKELAKTYRYNMLANAISPTLVSEIGRRLLA